MRHLLTSWPIIILSAVAFFAIGYGFSLYSAQTGEPILDMLASPADVLARLDAMTAEQKAAHAEMTLALDMLYPIAYAILLAGLVMKAFPNFGWWLAIPAFAACGLDIVENIIQLMALQGSIGLVGFKAFLTPTKFLFALIAVLLALVSWLTVGVIAIRKTLAS